MRKLLLLLFLFLFTSIAFAADVKTYYLNQGTYYTLFCPEPVLSFNMRSNGSISYSMTSDITNSKSFVTFFAQENGNMQVTIETPSGKKNYTLISDGSTPENCDENFYKIDIPKQGSPNVEDKI